MICDLVIFDGTPCNLVTDSIIISRYVDTTLIVSAYRMTKMDELETLKKNIENVGGKIAGVVINRTKMSQKQYYSTYYYGEHEREKEINEIIEEEKNKTFSEEEIQELEKELDEVEKQEKVEDKKPKETLKVKGKEINKGENSEDVDEEENAKIGIVKLIDESKEESKIKEQKEKEEEQLKIKELEDTINKKLGESKEDK
jgi:Mrp family chromosome partitioning ATPase